MLRRGLTPRVDLQPSVERNEGVNRMLRGQTEPAAAGDGAPRRLPGHLNGGAGRNSAPAEASASDRIREAAAIVSPTVLIDWGPGR